MEYFVSYFWYQVAKANPWQVEALKIVTGSEEAAHKPLTEILDECMNLKVDEIIDISGLTNGKYAPAMFCSFVMCFKFSTFQLFGRLYL